MIRRANRGISWGTLALVAVVGMAAGWGLRTAVGEGTPPTEDHGITRQRGPEVDLGPDLPGFKLRLGMTTFEPGAVRAIHDHKKNPEATFIVQGTLTEFRRGTAPQEFKAGSMRTNGRDVEHWLENHGAEKMVQVVASVVKAQ